MTTIDIDTSAGPIRGIQRDHSAAFLGIPFAQPPVGELRFAAPVPMQPWTDRRDATQMGATPQRRPLAEVTTIPEPSIPGESTLNVNVFTPRPGDRYAQLPVLVWIHGGGYTAGSPASPWYDGRAFNRDEVVTVTVSYRLGFDGFGWMADAPANRGLLDQIAALQWVHDHIADFGGDPDQVTIAGQSAGGGSVLTLLACPRAQALFRAVISHSGAAPSISTPMAEQRGRALAARAGVEPTRAGWSTLSEDQILDLQGATDLDLAAQLRTMTSGAEQEMLAWGPVVDGDLLPQSVDEALAQGVGADRALLIGTVASEFNGPSQTPIDQLPSVEERVAQVSAASGLDLAATRAIVAAHPDLDTASLVGQVLTEFLFRIPAIRAAARPGATWLYDFRWPSSVSGAATHCVELPFAWGLLDAEGVREALGDHPPVQLADQMHHDWVRFISTGDPGWTRCTPHPGAEEPGMVYDTPSHLDPAPYALETRLLGLI